MRRLPLLFTLLAPLLTGVLRASGSTDTIGVTLGPEFTIASNGTDIRHLSFLSYVNGTAIATYSEHPDTVVYPTVDGMSVSPDGGATWPIYHQSQNFYISSVIALANGSLMATSYITQRMDSLHTSIFTWISADNGASWMPYVGTLSLPSATPQALQNANWGGFLCHRTMMQMPDGSIQGTMYGKYVGDTRQRSVWVKSTDGGANWSIVSTIAYDPAIGSEGFDEPVVARVADGSLLAILRIGSAVWPLYQTRSTDGGLTWSAPANLPGVDPSATYSVDPDLTLMADGTLVLSYGRPTTNLLFSVDGSGYSWGFHVAPVFTASATNYMGTREVAPGKLLMITDNPAGTAIIGKYVTVTRTTHLPPAFTVQPSSQTVPAGSTVAFNAEAAGSPAPSYQWSFGGAPIPGATSPLLVLPGVTPANSGSYTCTASNANGAVTSSAATLGLASASNPGRLVNLSILSNISGSLSMGFVTGGMGTSGNEPLLIRAVGPSIGPGTLYNVPGVMPDPTLAVVQQTDHAVSFGNAGWGANQAAVTAADSATGAFPLSDPASKDSAIVQTLPPVGGGYSATVTGATGDGGYALAEVYDATANVTPASTRLVNLSCLTSIAAGGTLDVGFVLGGATARSLLIRASGPSLAAAPFNLGGTMPDPSIVVSPAASTASVLAANGGWGGDPQVSALAAEVGAFSFAGPASLDSAVVVTVQPGVPCAVQVRSASGAPGSVLVEIYELP